MNSEQTKKILDVMADFVRNDHRGPKVAEIRQLSLHEFRVEIDDLRSAAAIERSVVWTADRMH